MNLSQIFILINLVKRVRQLFMDDMKKEVALISSKTTSAMLTVNNSSCFNLYFYSKSKFITSSYQYRRSLGIG